MKIHISITFICTQICFILTNEIPKPTIKTETGTETQTGTESSEFVFSPEKHYLNDDQIEKWKNEDYSSFEKAPFETEERLWGTEPPPFKKKIMKVKGFFKKIFGRFTRPQNTTKPLLLNRIYNYVKYTLLKKTTEACTGRTTEDNMAFWSKHYTDWKYFNNLYFELLNSTDRNHWFYKFYVKEQFGEDLDDVTLSTRMEFDVERLEGFSTNLTLPPTDDFTENYDSGDLPDYVRYLTARPEFHRVIDEYIKKLTFPTLPPMYRPENATYFIQSDLYKRLRSKLYSFYWITTRCPDAWMDSHERKRNNKLGKWIVKEEKRVLEYVDDAMKTWLPDFGPIANSIYKYELSLTTKMSKIQKRIEAEKIFEKTTQNKDDKTKITDMPEHMRKKMEENPFNMSKFETNLQEVYKNNSFDWPFFATTTEPPIESITFTLREFTNKVDVTTEGQTIPLEKQKLLNSDNFTLSIDHFNKAYDHLLHNLRDLEIFKNDDYYYKASKFMWEDQFTSPRTTCDDEEVLQMFTDKYPDLV